MASQSVPGSGTPVIQITRHRITTTITSSCRVSSEEWNEDKGKVIIHEKTSSKRKKDNIVGKYIRYRRQKTGQVIIVELEYCMMRIIKRYADKHSNYIFPVLRTVENADDFYPVWRKTCYALSFYNKQLNELAALAGIKEHLTSYVARHSWATIASREGIPTAVISRGMGHDSEKTTQFYIARVDYSDVGKANWKILKQLVV
jgi:integrase